MKIQIQGVSKTFGDFHALRNVNLDVEEGELLAILGPSGSGKTTLLRIIAGLETPDKGEVSIDSTPIRNFGRGAGKVGFVFQHYALFRHMTVLENVGFGLRVRPRGERPSKPEIHNRVMRLLQLVQLESLANRYPAQLSGGQRQRVALARALAIEPSTLLLDEPFGALDAKVRRELRRWLRELHSQLNITSVFVTHDQEEALELADRVVVMRDGRVEQEGPAEDVYRNPANAFVYDFLGNVNLFHARIMDGKAHVGGFKIDLPEGKRDGGTAKVYVRPHLIDISREPLANGHSLRARVLHFMPSGARFKVDMVGESGESLSADLSEERYHELQLTRGLDVYVTPKEVNVFIGENI